MSKRHPRYNSFLKVRRKLRAIEYKGGECIRCGYSKWYGTLEFHHRDPRKKEFGWAKVNNKAWKTMKKELDKCDLLCANCHRETHADHGLLNEYKEWRRIMESRQIERKKPRICKMCKEEFAQKHSKNKYCSQRCSQKSRQIIDWPDDLDKMVRNSSKLQVAQELGVSNKAVAKRLRNHFGRVV